MLARVQPTRCLRRLAAPAQQWPLAWEVRHLAMSRSLPRAAEQAVAREVKVPTIDEARALPLQFCELSNETLFCLAEEGNNEACEERLARNVMAADEVDWMTAKTKVKEIIEYNKQVEWIVTLPYKVGISIAGVTGVGCIPMVFHQGTVSNFNKIFVTTDVPEPQDMETVWEIGSWAWNWMEPPLGTASFSLLAFQFIRAQMQNMDKKPYTEWVKGYRGKRLASAFPQYDTNIIKDFARTSSMTSRK